MWATQGDAPGVLRPSAWPACSAPPPFDRPAGCTRQWGADPSRSSFSPTPASSLHPPTSSRSSAMPGCSNSARWDSTSYGRVGSTAKESACQYHRTTPPSAANMASVSHCSPGRSPLCSAASPWPPARPHPTLPTRPRAHRRGNHWSCQSCQRGDAAAHGLQPRSHREDIAHARPGRAHTPGDRPA